MRPHENLKSTYGSVLTRELINPCDCCVDKLYIYLKYGTATKVTLDRSLHPKLSQEY